MITKVRKKIYYRMATFEGVDASITLQSLLKKNLRVRGWQSTTTAESR